MSFYNELSTYFQTQDVIKNIKSNNLSFSCLRNYHLPDGSYDVEHSWFYKHKNLYFIKSSKTIIQTEFPNS